LFGSCNRGNPMIRGFGKPLPCLKEIVNLITS
jgi:hypothetical protein